MPDFKLMAVEAGLRKMIEGKYFDICTIDATITAPGLKVSTQLYSELRLLHCVHYGDMSPELIEELSIKIMEVLNCPRMDSSRINVVAGGNGLKLVRHA